MWKQTDEGLGCLFAGMGWVLAAIAVAIVAWALGGFNAISVC